jgi:hypothetical protein
MAENGRGKAWLPFFWIILACAVAHLWCLGSQFYMDDFPQIRNNPGIQHGILPGTSGQSWTMLWYSIQYQLFGMSPVGFHAFNWILHTSVACSLFVLGREFLKGKWPQEVALFAALLFSVHPLASEIPNYARTQDLARATLFSLLAGWFLLKFLRHEGWPKIVACGFCVFGAAISKGPGFFHAALVCGAIGLAFMGEGRHQMTRTKLKYLGVAVLVAVCTLCLTGRLGAWWNYTAKWSEPRFIGHAYTLSRVFWEFAWRAVIPVGLSSDHEITETLIPPGASFWNIPDKAAMVAMAGFLALTAFSVFLACRKPTRLIGVCLFLFAATILFRFMYVIPEFMPEYRIYPGMPWFCLGAAIVLTAIWRYLFETVSPHVPAVILLAGFAFLSAKRSFVWHDVERLTGDVLKRYPARARALWEMNDRDAEAGNWQAIIDRQRQVWPQVEREFVERNKKLAPAREIPSGDFVLAMVAIHGHLARAIAHTQSPMAGLNVLAQLEAHMKRMQMTVENKRLEYGYLYHDRALILEMTGNYKAAAELLNMDCIPRFLAHDLKRLEEKLTAKPGS